jgi:hypothetical protein
VEVVVALSIGAVILLGARLLLENLGASAENVALAARREDADANGESLLRSLVRQIEVGSEARTFEGSENEARFTSWCATPAGWAEPCRVILQVSKEDSSVVLKVILPDASVAALRARDRMELRYLVDAREGGRWFVRWGEGASAPGAIGVLIDADTMIVRIGERG